MFKLFMSHFHSLREWKTSNYFLRLSKVATAAASWMNEDFLSLAWRFFSFFFFVGLDVEKFKVLSNISRPPSSMDKLADPFMGFTPSRFFDDFKVKRNYQVHSMFNFFRSLQTTETFGYSKVDLWHFKYWLGKLIFRRVRCFRLNKIQI